MMIKSYKQQYERMLRYLDRLKSQNGDQNEYIDDIFSFFQNCYNLKDWLKNDNALPSSVRNKIENEVDLSNTLRIVADLANRTKHLKLSKHIRENANMTGVDINIHAGIIYINRESMETKSASSRIEYRIKVETGNGHIYDGLKLAEDAVLEWGRICHKLSIPMP